MKEYVMIENRHNDGIANAIAVDYDFEKQKTNRTAYWNEAYRELSKGRNIKLYITGLTPVFIEFISEYLELLRVFGNKHPGTIHAMQYNSDKKAYFNTII